MATFRFRYHSHWPSLSPRLEFINDDPRPRINQTIDHFDTQHTLENGSPRSRPPGTSKAPLRKLTPSLFQDMPIVTGDRYLESLVKFVENQAESLIEGSLVLKLNPVGLRYVQSRLEALEELESLLVGAPVDYLRAYVSELGDHRALEQLRRILRLLPSLKVVSLLPPPGRDPTPLYLLPFARLKILELRGCDLSTSAAHGLLELRFTLEKLICHNSTDALRHIFASRIADVKDSPQWNRLSFVSCACNGLVLMDESLQLLPVLESLDLSRNKFAKMDNLKKCTKLNHVDLGFNSLRSIASFSEVSCQILKLVLRNNALTSLHGIENLKSLQGLDLSYNVISNFSEIECLSGLVSLQSLWLEGNPLCYARWFRAQVFSLFPFPEQLKLDEKKISSSEFWKRSIIIASRKKQPASFGFYSPAEKDADAGRSINIKRRGVSHVASIENDEHIISDQDPLSCDNDIQSEDKNIDDDEEAGIEDLMKRIEFMKKDHSVLWLNEFKDWMNQTSQNLVGEDEPLRHMLHNTPEFCLTREIKDEGIVGASTNTSDFHLSGDDSGIFNIESRAYFADTVGSVQQCSDGVCEAASTVFRGHDGGNISGPADVGDICISSTAVPKRENMTNEIVNFSSSALKLIMGSQTSSASIGSPPHYEEDILHRRHNLEEEFLQFSADSFSFVSSDSNTSCSTDDILEVVPSVSHVNHSVPGTSSTKSSSNVLLASDEDDERSAYRDKNSSLNQNGPIASSSCPKGYYSNDGKELQDDEILEFDNEKMNWLEQRKSKRKASRRIISLLEKDDSPGNAESSKMLIHHVPGWRSDTLHEKQQISYPSGMRLTTNTNGSLTTSTENWENILGVNASITGNNDFIVTHFNANVAHSKDDEVVVQYALCDILFSENSGMKERKVAVLRSSEQKLYILLVDACDGSVTTLENVGCHGVDEVGEVSVGLGLQVVRVSFGGSAPYLFITWCSERSRELLHCLDFFNSSRINPYLFKSLEQIQMHIFEKHVCGGSKMNILQYYMVLFSHELFKENCWLPRSLFMLKGHLLLCTEDLMQWNHADVEFSPYYFSLDCCCSLEDVSELVVDDTSDCLCATLNLRCTFESIPFPLRKECRKIGDVSLNEKPSCDVLTWKLKWFTKDGLFHFVTLLKANYAESTSLLLPVRYSRT